MFSRRVKRLHWLVLGIVLLSGCANVRQPIQHYRQFSTPISQVLTASVGSTLLRMNRQSDLPNAYGGKDIYHGKVDRGFVEVKLIKIAGKELTLSVSDINLQTSETTMDRYVVAPSVNLSQSVQIATSGEEGIIAKLNTAEEREYVVGGVKITFTGIRTSSVTYRIDDLTPVLIKK